MPFFALAIFLIHEILKKDQKMTGAKKMLKSKISCFMPVNHAQEFLKSIHTEALFYELFSQTFEQLFTSFGKFFINIF